MAALHTLAGALIALLVSPLVIAAVCVFLALWLVSTVTCVGPLIHRRLSRRDGVLLASLVSSPPTPASPVELVPVTADGRRLAVRWSPGPPGCVLPPVAVPNGLGATLVSVGRLHDALVGAGFPTLTYDRAGVGQSDPLPAGVHHFGAAPTCADMHALLCRYNPPRPGRQPWILVGPSMGSVVAQAYLASQAGGDRTDGGVGGFLNLDGFPFPFGRKRGRFAAAARVYAAYAAIVWTGVLRPFLAAAGAALAPIASAAFPVAVVAAQTGQANFFGSLAREMLTMLDCADAVQEAWGRAFDVGAMGPDALAPLVRAAPALCGGLLSAPAAAGSGGDGAGLLRVKAAAAAAAGPASTWEELPRSAWEHGDSWAPADTAAAVEGMRAEHAAAGGAAPLPAVWRTLVVRVMSARSYAFPGGGSFYDEDMKAWAAAEHALHAALPRDGARRVPRAPPRQPVIHHGGLCSGADCRRSLRAWQRRAAVLRG